MARSYTACLKKVQGSHPPVAFLDELVDWGSAAADDLFAANKTYDIYSSVYARLGPYRDIPHRKAVMLEVLRVLAGHESTWRWNAGVDAGKTSPKTSHTEEAGAFQMSADAMEHDASLKQLVQDVAGATDDATFIATTKSNHAFAIEFAARMLRVSVNHNGPVKHHLIHPELSKASVTEFQGFL